MNTFLLYILVDGAWGAWGNWGDCTKSCASGRKSRSRICDNPKPANGGLDCPGSSGDFEYCNTHDCPTVPAGTYQQVGYSPFKYRSAGYHHIYFVTKNKTFYIPVILLMSTSVVQKFKVL